MSKPILIAQITDLHIKPPGELAYGKVDTAEALRKLVNALNRLRPAPDLVVVTGDLVDGGSPEEYQHLLLLLEGLKHPLAVTAGNHDDRRRAREAFPNQPFADGEALNQIRSLGPIDVVLLDSSVPGLPHGCLEPTTLNWLERALIRMGPSRPALLFLHHPPFATGIWHMDRQPLTNPEPLAAIIARHPQVRLVAAGHVHRAVTTRFAGTVASICPAPNHAVALDLNQAMEPSFMIEPALPSPRLARDGN